MFEESIHMLESFVPDFAPNDVITCNRKRSINADMCSAIKVFPHTHTHTHTHTAYGYGTLMVILVSLGSLGGIIVVPLLKKNSKFGYLYKYVYALMIALGASALFCDAILHLIPHVS